MKKQEQNFCQNLKNFKFKKSYIELYHRLEVLVLGLQVLVVCQTIKNRSKSNTTFHLLDVQKKVVKFINYIALPVKLSFAHHRAVSDLSLFYRKFLGFYSREPFNSETLAPFGSFKIYQFIVQLQKLNSILHSASVKKAISLNNYQFK